MRPLVRGICGMFYLIASAIMVGALIGVSVAMGAFVGVPQLVEWVRGWF